MASKASLKIQRDKEMAAMLYNSKEQRVLEKSLQTLSLEQTYALKLLELDHRIIKVRYKKLKENVSKIKSHLPVDDISNFRDLDLQGKLNAGPSGVNLSSALKIAAAARRLNLGAGLKRRTRTRSALPTISVQKDPESDGILSMRSKSVVSINEPPKVNRIKRSNSITGAFIDAPNGDSDTKHRPVSALLPHNRRPQTVNGCTPTRTPEIRNQYTNQSRSAMSAHVKNTDSCSISPLENSASLALPLESPRVVSIVPSTGAPKPDLGFIPVKDTLDLPLETKQDQTYVGSSSHEPMVTFRSSSSLLHRPRSPFSSHSQVPRRASAPVRQSKRRLSHISTDSIDSNLGESSHEERRQELLEEEGVRSATLDQRTRLFLKDVDEYLIRNPPLQASHVAFENDLPEPPRRDSLLEPAASQAGLDPQANSRSVRFRYRRGEVMPGEEQNITPTFFPEVEYKERLMGLWKDMNKCRYLRVPDEKIDLSGVNTLAKDQMKLFETLRSAEPQPLQQAWDT